DNIDSPYSSEEVIVPPYLPDHPLIREEIAQYYDEIARFDRHVGQVLDELTRQKLIDDTFILYVSDNGMPFPRAKTTLYDSGIRTPLLVRYPALTKPGTVQRNLVSTIDIAPTVLELAGITQTTTQGQSLARMLKDPRAPGREAIFAEANWHDFEKFTRAVRTERFLLIRNYYWDKPLWNSVDSVNSQTWTGYLEMQRYSRLTDSQRFLFAEPRPFEEFYDLKIDPHSLTNAVGTPNYADAVNQLRTRLDNWRVETHDRMPETRRRDGWTRDGRPLPHNQPWYDRYIEARGKSDFEKF
ncbi:MAG: sulfatase-like hydrolase/transferase, partial [Planctomycetes bacterium]|nr:sulfatase-like hydrolase/transferase [Planctomycetota bacterium]